MELDGHCELEVVGTLELDGNGGCGFVVQDYRL